MDIEDSSDASSDEVVKKKRRIENSQLPPAAPTAVVFPSKVWLKNIFPHFSIENISRLESVSRAMKAMVTHFFHDPGALERYFADSLHASMHNLGTKFYHNGFIGNGKNAKIKRRIMHNAMENFILTAKNPMDGLRLLRASTDTELQKKFLEIDGNPTIHDIAIAATAISRTSHKRLNPTLFTNVAHALEQQPSGTEEARFLTDLVFIDLAKALNKCPNRNIVRPLFQPLLLNARRISAGRASDEFVSSMANTMGKNASFFAHENLKEFQSSYFELQKQKSGMQSITRAEKAMIDLLQCIPYLRMSMSREAGNNAIEAIKKIKDPETRASGLGVLCRASISCPPDAQVNAFRTVADEREKLQKDIHADPPPPNRNALCEHLKNADKGLAEIFPCIAPHDMTANCFRAMMDFQAQHVEPENQEVRHALLESSCRALALSEGLDANAGGEYWKALLKEVKQIPTGKTYDSSILSLSRALKHFPSDGVTADLYDELNDARKYMKDPRSEDGVVNNLSEALLRSGSIPYFTSRNTELRIYLGGYSNRKRFNPASDCGTLCNLAQLLNKNVTDQRSSDDKKTTKNKVASELGDLIEMQSLFPKEHQNAKHEFLMNLSGVLTQLTGYKLLSSCSQLIEQAEKMRDSKEHYGHYMHNVATALNRLPPSLIQEKMQTSLDRDVEVLKNAKNPQNTRQVDEVCNLVEAFKAKSPKMLRSAEEKFVATREASPSSQSRG